jgi:hypothetical protein
MILFITTTVKTSNPTKKLLYILHIQIFSIWNENYVLSCENISEQAMNFTLSQSNIYAERRLCDVKIAVNFLYGFGSTSSQVVLEDGQEMATA